MGLFSVVGKQLQHPEGLLGPHCQASWNLTAVRV